MTSVADLSTKNGDSATLVLRNPYSVHCTGTGTGTGTWLKNESMSAVSVLLFCVLLWPLIVVFHVWRDLRL